LRQTSRNYIVAYPQAFFARDPKTGQITGSFTEVPIHRDGTPTRMPILPSGKFALQVRDPEHPETWKMAEVEIKAEWLQEMVQNFQDGFPGPAGVPVDQRSDHSKNPDGAYGFWKNLDIENGVLYADFEPTEYGLGVIGQGGLPYVSPFFTVGDGADVVWGKRNIVIGGALTSSPQLTGQGQMVLASAIPPQIDTQAASAADSSHEGVSDMTDAEFQAKIDEAVAAAIAGKQSEWDAAQVALVAEKDALVAERDALTGQLEGLQAVAGDAEAVKRELELLKAQAEKDAADRRFEMAKAAWAAVREVEVKVIDGADGMKTAQENILVLTPEAVEVAASAQVDPLKAPAMFALMAAHGGKLPTMIAPDAPPKGGLLVGASARAGGGGGGLTMDQQIDAQQDWDLACKDYVKRACAGGMSMADARKAYRDAVVPIG
jgi:hypothetical protein